MKIFVFADPHYSDIEVSCNTRRPSRSLEKLRGLTDVIARCGRIICLGDLTDKCETYNECGARLSEISGFLHSFGVPVDALMGNHDCQSFTADEFSRIGRFRTAPYCTATGDTTLIFLDANYLKDGHRAYRTHSNWTDANLPDDQFIFLGEALARTPRGGRAIVCLHQCLDPAAEPRHIIQNAAEIRALLSRTAAMRGIGIHALSGHYHRGGANEVDGVSYTTVPAMCELDRIPYIILDV